MAWTKGHQREILSKYDSIQDARDLKGELEAKDAKLALFKLLSQNLGFTWKLLTQNKGLLYEWQELIINAWFRKDYSLVVAGRGTGKTTIIGIFCLLYCIFNPDSKIVLIANNFRTVKNIFSSMEKLLKETDSNLLRQCFKNKIGKSPDQYLLECLNGSSVKGLPLGGDNLRGQRANVLIIDEGLLISEHLQKTILEPFLIAKLNPQEQEKNFEQETELIKAGRMKEEERTFSNNKLIITSSASFKFEYLYEGIFKPYIDIITDEHRKRELSDPSYFVAKISIKAVPEGTITDEAVLKAASEGRENDPNHLKEYHARFVDASDSYFDIKKLNECTYQAGEMPTVQVRGAKGSQYVLAIDPAYSASKSSDFFAMGVYLLIPEERRIVQVHSYGKAGGDVKDHYDYLIYLLTSFNIAWLAIDASGTEFIDSFNESSAAMKYNIKLGYLNPDFDREGEEYIDEVRKIKNQWNVLNKNIVCPILFSGINNRKMNEYLQGGISAKKVWFASPITQHGGAYEAAIVFNLPFEFKDTNDEVYTKVQFLDDQDDWISHTKKQLALIEVRSTGQGTLQYDIPNHLKRSKSATRVRRDNYSCLLMAYFASKFYFDMLQTEDDIAPASFTPFFL